MCSLFLKLKPYNSALFGSLDGGLKENISGNSVSVNCLTFCSSTWYRSKRSSLTKRSSTSGDKNFYSPFDMSVCAHISMISMSMIQSWSIILLFMLSCAHDNDLCHIVLMFFMYKLDLTYGADVSIVLVA